MAIQAELDGSEQYKVSESDKKAPILKPRLNFIEFYFTGKQDGKHSLIVNLHFGLGSVADVFTFAAESWQSGRMRWS